MYIIVGLGNPTLRYRKTRHNIGFEMIDRLAGQHAISLNEKKHKAVCGKGIIGGEKVVLAKPQTYMNLSGESASALLRFYKVDPGTELIVVYDDVSLDVGQLRIRKQGSAGGHNGIKSIIEQIGSNEFYRIKIGVGNKPPQFDLADYVLGKFQKEERKIMDEALERGAEAIETILKEDINTAMNKFNKKVV